MYSVALDSPHCSPSNYVVLYSEGVIECKDALAEPVNPLEGEYTLTEPVILCFAKAINFTGLGPTALVLECLLLEEAKEAELLMSYICFFCLSDSGKALALLPPVA